MREEPVFIQLQAHSAGECMEDLELYSPDPCSELWRKESFATKFPSPGFYPSLQ